MGGRRVRMMDRKIEGEGNERVDERMGKGDKYRWKRSERTGRKKKRVKGEKRPDQSPVRMTSQHRANGALN